MSNKGRNGAAEGIVELIFFLCNVVAVVVWLFN